MDKDKFERELRLLGICLNNAVDHICIIEGNYPNFKNEENSKTLTLNKLRLFEMINVITKIYEEERVK